MEHYSGSLTRVAGSRCAPTNHIDHKRDHNIAQLPSCQRTPSNEFSPTPSPVPERRRRLTHHSHRFSLLAAQTNHCRRFSADYVWHAQGAELMLEHAIVTTTRIGKHNAMRDVGIDERVQQAHRLLWKGLKPELLVFTTIAPPFRTTPRIGTCRRNATG